MIRRRRSSLPLRPPASLLSSVPSFSTVLPCPSHPTPGSPLTPSTPLSLPPPFLIPITNYPSICCPIFIHLLSISCLFSIFVSYVSIGVRVTVPRFLFLLHQDTQLCLRGAPSSLTLPSPKWNTSDAVTSSRWLTTFKGRQCKSQRRFLSSPKTPRSSPAKGCLRSPGG